MGSAVFRNFEIPDEYKNNKEDYINLICDVMIPEISKLKLAEFCDVFCENKYFNFENTREL